MGVEAEVLPMTSIADQHGPFLRVEEAARVLRISRTSAYALARLWLDSGGTDGLPGREDRTLGPHPGRRARSSGQHRPTRRRRSCRPATARRRLTPQLQRWPSRELLDDLQTGARLGRCGLMLRVTTLYALSAVATAAYYTRYLADAPGRGAGPLVGPPGRRAWPGRRGGSRRVAAAVGGS